MNTSYGVHKTNRTQQEVAYINKAVSMYDKAIQYDKIQQAHKSSVLSYVALAVIFIVAMSAVAYMVIQFIR